MPNSLYAKLAQFQAGIGGLRADKTAKVQTPKANYSYTYLSESALCAKIRNDLSSQGVATFVSVESEEQVGNLTKVRVSVTFADAESGETHVVFGVGYGTDQADKGANKAITSATRVILTKNMLQGGDVDPEEHYVERAERVLTPKPVDPNVIRVKDAIASFSDEEKASLAEWCENNEIGRTASAVAEAIGERDLRAVLFGAWAGDQLPPAERDEAKPEVNTAHTIDDTERLALDVFTGPPLAETHSPYEPAVPKKRGKLTPKATA